MEKIERPRRMAGIAEIKRIRGGWRLAGKIDREWGRIGGVEGIIKVRRIRRGLGGFWRFGGGFPKGHWTRRVLRRGQGVSGLWVLFLGRTHFSAKVVKFKSGENYTLFNSVKYF